MIKIKSSYYKSLALDSLKGNWGREWSVGLIYIAMLILAEFIGYENESISIILSLLLMPLGFGYSKRFLDMANNEEVAGVKGLFCFYSSSFFSLFLVNIVISIFTILWSFLLIIPGIIASISYSLALFIKMENSEMGTLDCIRLSQEMMEGYKMEYFILSLSFIGWGILAVISVVGLIPYMIYLNSTLAYFYTEIRDDYNKKIEVM